MTRVRAALESDVAERTARLSECVEDQWFDRTSSRTRMKDLGPLLTAFANAEGGIVVIGVGEPLPAADALLREWQQAPVDFTSPPVRAQARAIEALDATGARTWVGVIEVESSEGVHETQDGTCYLRIGDETRRLTFTQRQELHFDKGQSTFDGRPVRNTSIDDLAPELVSAYRDATGTRLDQATLLRNRGALTTGGEATHAGILLFGSRPQQHLPGAEVRLLRYRGTDRGSGRTLAVDADSDIRLSGTLPEQIEEAAGILDEWVPARRSLGASGRFERVPVIPRDVWLEAVVNAVVHRSYSLAGDHIRVEVFDDRIEVTSPGRFPGLVRLDDPEKVARFSRNPRIARVMVDLQIVRELGEGIRRMFVDMRDNGLLDPEYRQTEGSVTVVLRTESRLDPAVLARLPKHALAALKVLRTSDRPLGTGDVENALGLARPTVIRVLNALRDESLVEWRGQSKRDPRATWTVVHGPTR